MALTAAGWALSFAHADPAPPVAPRHAPSASAPSASASAPASAVPIKGGVVVGKRQEMPGAARIGDEGTFIIPQHQNPGSEVPPIVQVPRGPLVSGSIPFVVPPPGGDGLPPPRMQVETFTDVVALTTATGAVRCTGIVVGPRHVLTARHCLPVGTVILGNNVKNSKASYRVIGSSATPDPTLDAAVVVTDRPLNIPPRVRRRDGRAPAPRGLLRVVGFGAREITGHDGAGLKRFADLITSGWGCDSSRAARFGCRPEIEMLIPRQGDADTCDGDSGGPVFERFGSGYRLLAITSRAVRGSRQRCGDGGIYTRVDQIAGWIDGIITTN